MDKEFSFFFSIIQVCADVKVVFRIYKDWIATYLEQWSSNLEVFKVQKWTINER